MALGRTVAELNASLTYSEFRAWEAYYAVEPWGAARDNMHAGLIAAAIGNTNRKKGSRPLTFKDFMLTPRDEQFRDNRQRFFGMLRANAKPKPGVENHG